VLLIVVIVILGVAAIILYNSQSAPIPTEHTISIVNGTATVNAGTHLDYPFAIPSDASSISVSGTFTAQGGSGNDIKVYVLDSTNFDKYKSGDSFTSLYQSGQIHSGSINADIVSSGNYHLVLDNKFSTISQKTVNIEASAIYTK
jgi:hypothetical protein